MGPVPARCSSEEMELKPREGEAESNELSRESSHIGRCAVTGNNRRQAAVSLMRPVIPRRDRLYSRAVITLPAEQRRESSRSVHTAHPSDHDHSRTGHGVRWGHQRGNAQAYARIVSSAAYARRPQFLNSREDRSERIGNSSASSVVPVTSASSAHRRCCPGARPYRGDRRRVLHSRYRI